MSRAIHEEAIKARLLRNSFFNSFSWGANALINLAAIPLMVHFLGFEGYGVYVLLTGLVGYFGLLDFGISEGVVKYVSHFSGLNDKHSLCRLLSTALVIQFCVGVVGLATLCYFQSTILRILQINPATFPEASLCLWICAFGFFFTMLMGTFASTLKGLQRFDILGKINVVFSPLTALSVLVVLFLGGKLLGAVVVTVVATFLNLATDMYFVRRLFPELFVSFRLTLWSFRPFLAFSGYVFALRFSSLLNSHFLRFVIASILGPAAVSYFVIPMRLTGSLEGAVNSLGGVIFPFASYHFAQGEADYLRRVYVQASRYLAALSAPLFFFVICFAKPMLTLWIGPEFAQRAWLVQSLLGCASLLAVLTMVPVNVVLGMGRAKTVAFFAAVVALFNLVFAITLTSKWGVTGAAAAVLITAVQGPFMIWYATKKIILLPWRQYFDSVFAVHLMPLSAVLLVSWLLFRVLSSVPVVLPVVAVTGWGAVSVCFYYYLLVRRGVICPSELRTRLRGLQRLRA